MKPLGRDARKALDAMPERSAIAVSWMENYAGLAHGRGSRACRDLLDRGLVKRLSRGIYQLTDAGRTERLRTDAAGPPPKQAPRPRSRHAVWL